MNGFEKLVAGKRIATLFREVTYVPIRLDSGATRHVNIESMDALEHFIWSQFPDQQNAVGVGGYLERRSIYHRQSSYADYRLPSGHLRDTHLALDFWTGAETPVYAPLDGIVHSMTYTPVVGQFGGCVVLRHQIDGVTFHTLYGHLSRDSVVDYESGQSIQAGQELARLGKGHENGYWPAHLHFQLVIDMQDMHGDYYGVAAQSELNFYRRNCPDPNLLLKIQCLTDKISNQYD